MSKISNLRSVKYLFEQKNGKLIWTALNSETDETEIDIISRKFYLCEVPNGVSDEFYYNNICYIEHILEKGIYKCKTTIENEYSVHELTKDTKYSFFQEVDLPLKVRYYIGTYTYHEIEKSEYGRQYGKFSELIEQGEPVIPKEKTTYYFYDFNKFSLDNEGIIYIETPSNSIAKQLVNLKKIKSIECISDKRELSEEIIDSTYNKGESGGLNKASYIFVENNLIVINFKKREGGRIIS